MDLLQLMKDESTVMIKNEKKEDQTITSDFKKSERIEVIDLTSASHMERLTYYKYY